MDLDNLTSLAFRWLRGLGYEVRSPHGVDPGLADALHVKGCHVARTGQRPCTCDEETD